MKTHWDITKREVTEDMYIEPRGLSMASQES